MLRLKVDLFQEALHSGRLVLFSRTATASHCTQMHRWLCCRVNWSSTCVSCRYLIYDRFTLRAGIRSSESITNWRNFFRNLCSAYVDRSGDHWIGGVGFTVEIDESLIFKRKNHVGRLLLNEATETWIFGGICRETSDAFIVPVQNRDTETLLCALQENVLPGTRVISDCWRAYDAVSQHGYIHQKINHSLHFVDPEDPSVNTQRIERMWKTLKSTIPRECSTDLRWTYLAEFLEFF
jgi:hypothetical protein